MYRKLKLSRRNLSKEIALAFSIKDVNDVCGTDGLVPSLLAFGTLPATNTLHEPQLKKLTQSERQLLIQQATALMETEMAK